MLDVKGLVAGICRNDGSENQRLEYDKHKIGERQCGKNFCGKVCPGELQMEHVPSKKNNGLDC